jgi:phosphoribosyl-dephospho-CoA transferase
VVPEDLTDVDPPNGSEVAATRALGPVRRLLGEAGVSWGPTGSVGFELATGSRAASPDSDLDLLIRAPDLTTATLTRLTPLHQQFAQLGVQVDCQVETRMGAIALAELLSASSDMLVKTPLGPRLIQRAVAVS